MRDWWKRFLQRIAEANERQFGNQPPDCCRRPEQGIPDPSKQRKGDIHKTHHHDSGEV